MARRKKTSEVYEKALNRAAALKSIDPNLDLGNGITMSGFETAITDARKAFDDYNTQLSDVDGLLNQALAKEKVLCDWHERVLTGVATRFGKDSNEYEQAGGVRKSERKRPVRNKKAA